MRLNESITSHEVEVPEGESLVSYTDTDGRIVFVNEPFTRISGFNAQELVGLPHNIVRHPDMPGAAFADLWQTVKVGRPWEGMVKNRTRNGDYYWGCVTVTPMIEGGEVVGYISILERPNRAEVARAEAAYARLRAGDVTGLQLLDGEITEVSWQRRLASFWASVLGRLLCVVSAVILTLVALGVLAMQDMRSKQATLRAIYEDGMGGMGRLGEILAGLQESLTELTRLEEEVAARQADAIMQRQERLRSITERVERTWQAYRGAARQPELQPLLERFAAGLAAYRQAEGAALALRPGAGAATAGLVRQATSAAGPAIATLQDLMQMELRLAGQNYEQSTAGFGGHILLVLLLVGGSVLLVCGFGWSLIMAVRRPLAGIHSDFEAIMANRYGHRVALPAAREFRMVASQLRALKARQAYAFHVHSEGRRELGEARRQAIRTIVDKIEAETYRAMRQVTEQTTEMSIGADSVAAVSARVTEHATEVNTAAGIALVNAQAVGAATEQLSTSIREISTRMGEVSARARSAAEGSAVVQERIRSLCQLAEEIDTVVALISEIAGKTNLLALNATIEAARAGAAGRGFAVVASEVKSLATRTASSTDEIRRQVEGIQAASRAAVEAAEAIGQSIMTTAEVAVAVAAVAEEQAVTTKAIAQGAAETATAARRVFERIDRVTCDATDASMQIEAMRTGSSTVADCVRDLEAAFVYMIRTSISDADRRSDPRFPVNLPSTVVDAWGGHVKTQLYDISRGGGSIGDVPGLQEGSRGEILFHHGGKGARVGFEVRWVGGDGRLHLRFVEQGISAEASDCIAGMIALAEQQAGDVAEPVGRRRHLYSGELQLF
ncbi:PAS domain-containing protein [Rhodovastum atsumiense]|uniref:PAS domain-containing protein n=1 Tax=Rhodovastum atsumiense TaxID=504468 RepID=A0A5M6ISD5_9PROT|nr:methyl-accepting chemotaxis protein [Rhodovastum atsumiense]KAA5610385.1 PAS domain-containing protein [Rhodovastum atsumiense]CAH2602940.1 PAS domain-containing protein [Rhodovastum atsumiense]